MTYCPKLYKLVEKGLEQKKSLKEIGQDLCPGVKHPEAKISRIVKMTMGLEEGKKFLLTNKWTGYKLPKNPTGRNGKDKPENSGLESNPKSEETPKKEVPVIINLGEAGPSPYAKDIEPEPEAEKETEKFNIEIGYTVKNHLDYIKEKITYRYGEPIETDSSVIIFLLRASGLWDYERFRKKD